MDMGMDDEMGELGDMGADDEIDMDLDLDLDDDEVDLGRARR